MAIVVVTYTNCDPSVEAVIAAAAAYERVFRLDADHFPLRVRLVLESGPGVERGWLSDGDDRLELSEVRAVWFHATWVGFTLPESLDPALRRSCQDLSAAALQDALLSLPCFIVDPFTHMDDKQVQQRAALRVGLDVPRSLLTNDPAAVRAFATLCPSGIITKAAAYLRLDEPDGGRRKMYTSALSEADLQDLDGLSLCPMIFQELLEKEQELRIVVAGRQVFSAAIDARGSATGQLDWRRDHSVLLDQWVPATLPAEVEARLLALMDLLGLNFGAIDMIVTPDGRYVFLEVNANGGGFEGVHRAGLPVAEGIARLLAGLEERRPPTPGHVFGGIRGR